MTKRRKRKKKLTKKKKRQLLGAAITVVCILLGIPLLCDYIEAESIPVFLQDPYGFLAGALESGGLPEDISLNDDIRYDGEIPGSGQVSDALAYPQDSAGQGDGTQSEDNIQDTVAAADSAYRQGDLSIALPPPEDGVTIYEDCDVVRVVDGDTIIVDLEGTSERVRLIGVDTPESVHPDKEKNVPYGEIASAFAKEMLEGKTVTLEMDVQERDRYNRILAYVYLDGIMFNGILLEEGHAKIATYPPNVKYVDTFKAIQKQAREEKRGLWSYEESTDTEK